MGPPRWGRAGRIVGNRIDTQLAEGYPVAADGGLRGRRSGKSGLLRLQPVKSEISLACAAGPDEAGSVTGPYRNLDRLGSVEVILRFLLYGNNFHLLDSDLLFRGGAVWVN